MGNSAHETSYALLREALRGAVLTAVESGSDGGIGSVPCRATAALHALLGDHPIDRRGRCRSCRSRRLWLVRVRRVCRVLVTARFYLHQPGDVLLCHFTSELDEPTLTSRSTSNPLTPPSPAVSPNPPHRVAPHRPPW